MPLDATQVHDLTVLHRIGLDRYSTGVVRRIVTVLREVEADITGQLARGWPDAENRARSPEALRLQALLAQVDRTLEEAHDRIAGIFDGVVTDTAATEADFIARLSAASVGTEVALATVSPQQLRSAAVSRPFQGRYLRDFVSEMSTADRRRVAGQIRMAYLEGESVRGAIGRVRRVHDVSKRGAEVLVRTSFTHINARAVEQNAAANPDLFRKWQFIAVLDTRTTPRCRALAGSVFDHGSGPLPPQHPNCRSTIASLPPGVSTFGDTTFASWLKRQPATYQRDVLGPRRYERYRDGIDTADSYVRDGRYLSLADLRARDGEILRRAGA